MRGDVDVFYRIPKDLAYQYVKRHVYRDSVKLAVMKACADHYITRKTAWAVHPLLTEGGYLAIYCDWYNLSEVLRYLHDETWPHDVLLFRSSNRTGIEFQSTYDCVVPVVVAHKEPVPVDRKKPNVFEVEPEDVLQQTAVTLLSATSPGDLIMYIGDSMIAAPVAKQLGREIVVFGNDEVASAAVFDEGVREGVI